MKAHCDGGAWVGGNWIPIEDCAETFLCESRKPSHLTGKCGRSCANCPRSGSARSAAKPDGSYDIVIIGAGCIGSAVARELSKTNASVLLIEAADDVSQGATKGNSGIVHAGFDDKPGSVRAKFCSKGCLMFPKLDNELHFGYQRNGSLVVARNAEEEAILRELLEQGEKNGVTNLRILSRSELFEREPNLAKDCTSALLAEDAGTIVPYEYCIALAENAVDNGVEVRIRREVVGIERNTGPAPGPAFAVKVMHWEPSQRLLLGHTNSRRFHPGVFVAVLAVGLVAVAAAFAALRPLSSVAVVVGCGAVAALSLVTSALAATKQSRQAVSSAHTFSGSRGTTFAGPAVEETILCDFIVNCAGSHSDKIAAMLGDTSFRVNERHGDYVLLNKKEGKHIQATIFPCPGPLGKGVLVQNTLWGNCILGPTARDTFKKDESGNLVVNHETLDMPKERIFRYIFTKCRELVPGFNAREIIHSFSGARAKTTRGDWIIEPCPTEPRMIHAAGIDSPGLAGSPAIAVEVVRLLIAAGATCAQTVNQSFNPLRAPLVVPKKGLKDSSGRSLRYGAPGAVPDPHENVVCKCEKVTEAEIVAALRRSLPVDNTQAVRRRTRAGMGHCQGDPKNYDCEARVAAIIARELGIPVEDVGRRPWPASSLMPKRFFDSGDRDMVENLSH